MLIHTDSTDPATGGHRPVVCGRRPVLSDPGAMLDPMNREQFWQLIEQARGAVPDSAPVWEQGPALAARAAELLAERGPAEVLDAQRELQGLLAVSFRDSLWAAAYLLNGGCSDDAFDYFRGWLIAQGREAFESAVADPDSLAALPSVQAAAAAGMELDCEDVLGIGWNAYRATGGDPAEGLAGVRVPRAAPDDPDWAFDFDDQEVMAAKLPRLSALVG